MAGSAPQVAGVAELRIDHVPIAVRDLQAAIGQFSAFGFTIKPGRPHDNGIENASIKFQDGSYIELITSHGDSDATSREYRDFLQTQEGARYAFLRDTAPAAFSAAVLRAGGSRSESGPFAFTRLPKSWKVPGLQLIEYLAPAVDPPAVLTHGNGALGIGAMWIVVDSGDAPLVRMLGARPASHQEWTIDGRSASAVTLGNSCLLLTPREATDPPRSTTLVILILVDSFGHIPSALVRALQTKSPVGWLSPAVAHGVRLGFTTAYDWRSTCTNLPRQLAIAH